MDRYRLQELLDQVARGALSSADALNALTHLPFERLGDHAMVDHHRELRSGMPEVVLGEWKSPEQIIDILIALARNSNGALATRVSADKANAVVGRVPGAVYYERARMIVIPRQHRARDANKGASVAVVAAGTSDLPVAEEAAITLEFLGYAVDRVTDIGVAGLHRLLANVDRLRSAAVVIVVAGMEGALPSVVAGLIDRPVIAVPTSVGYGVGAGGFAALVGMLSSCAPGVTVVNIDNGFGAAVGAARILGSLRPAPQVEKPAETGVL